MDLDAPLQTCTITVTHLRFLTCASRRRNVRVAYLAANTGIHIARIDGVGTLMKMNSDTSSTSPIASSPIASPSSPPRLARLRRCSPSPNTPRLARLLSPLLARVTLTLLTWMTPPQNHRMVTGEVGNKSSHGTPNRTERNNGRRGSQGSSR